MKQKQVEWTFEQRVAISGHAHTEEDMMLLIREGRDIALAGGVPEQKHLRYAVMTGRLPVRVIGSMVEFGCDPSDAMDYCVSPRMVRALVKNGGDPSKLTYFGDSRFVDGDSYLESSHEEKFRKPKLLFKTFRERILLGGVFPAHVVDWYDEFVDWDWEYDYSDELLGFRRMYKAAVGPVISVYKMTTEFVRYKKFLPVRVFFNRHFESVSARVCGVVQAPQYGMRLSAGSKNKNVRELRRVLEKLLDVEHEGITRLVVSFL